MISLFETLKAILYNECGGGTIKITTLYENSTINPNLKFGHGLSLYVELTGKNILFDLGPNKHFWKNAKKLGIDLCEVDYLVLSHGHYDHGTELGFFLKKNRKAKVFLSKYIFDKHIGKRKNFNKNIGIKRVSSDRLNFVGEDYEIFEGLKLITNVDYLDSVMADRRLQVVKDGELILDHFDHEIYLMVKDKKTLITGCSHKGIQNIVDTIEYNESIEFDYVIGGFHLKKYDDKSEDQKQFVVELAKEFSSRKTSFITCHCTGEKAFEEMKQHMENIVPLHTGSVVEL